MTFLTKSSRIKELETKAANWDNLVTAVRQSDPTLTDEQITPEIIVDALSVENQDTESAGLLTIANNRIAELEEQVANLQGGPAEDPAGVNSDSEPDGKPQDFATVIKKQSGDHGAVLETARKEGLI